MDIQQARERLQVAGDELAVRIEERVKLVSDHEGDRTFRYLAPFYSDTLRWMGRTTVTLAEVIKEVVSVTPTIYMHHRHNQREL